MVKRILIQKCLPTPTCKNTPRGGRRIAAMMRSRSIRNLLGSAYRVQLAVAPGPGWPLSKSCLYLLLRGALAKVAAQLEGRSLPGKNQFELRFDAELTAGT